MQGGTRYTSGVGTNKPLGNIIVLVSSTHEILIRPNVHTGHGMVLHMCPDIGQGDQIGDLSGFIMRISLLTAELTNSLCKSADHTKHDQNSIAQ